MKRFEPPDQFMYRRQGPWPQPSPSYPLLCANEVLNVPELEQFQFNLTIGARYMQDQVAFAPYAAEMAIADMPGQDRLPTSAALFAPSTASSGADETTSAPTPGAGVERRKYDFSAMRLIVKTIEAPTPRPSSLRARPQGRAPSHLHFRQRRRRLSGRMCVRP
jgi:hypothetical protein